MKTTELMDIMHKAEKLKDTMRHCYTSEGRRESVAEHSWRIALMAYFVKDEYPDVDIDRVIRMCLIHDLGEIFTGDIPVFMKKEEDELEEERILNEWVQSLPEPYAAEMTELYREMEEQKSLESRVYKALDSLEAIVQHNESDLSTWEPHEYELNRTYAYDRVEFSEYMKELRREIRQETEAKIEKGQNSVSDFDA